jgi:2-keto-4-pentenoate hydratase/2-oxohepta-3-ene-1,7-dioic acid hydratase in catechol pathway
VTTPGKIVCVSGPAGNRSTRSARSGPRVVPRQATADVIFTVAELVAFVSETITLVPGDLIATGTPPGVALGRSDPRYLEPGETVEVEIEGIGVLRNLIVAG